MVSMVINALSTEQTDQWVIGWKNAHLLVSRRGILAFEPISEQSNLQVYDFEDEAACFHGNSPPHPDCSCGYYAFASRADAHRIERWKSKYGCVGVLRVALRGTIEVGVAGREGIQTYRSGYQRVTDVFIPPWCQLCEGDDHLATRVAAGKRVYGYFNLLLPACEGVEVERSFALHELRQANPIGVHWLSIEPPAA